MPGKPDTWHREAISDDLEAVLRALPGEPVHRRFYLAGGTALALQLGHRRSLDLDFFTEETFDEEAVIAAIRNLPAFELIAKDKQTVHAHIHGVKVTFLGYAYPLLFPLSSYLGARVAEPREIACMKISAIAARATRRDFIDLYAVCRLHQLPHLIGLFQRKYGRVSLVHIVKSLTYFEDAEKDSMPRMLVPVSWDAVKSFFLAQATRLL